MYVYFFVNTNFVEHYRHFLSTYFLLDPFVLFLSYSAGIDLCIVLMMAQSRTESTRDIYNYGQYINQFPPNTIKTIRTDPEENK